MAGPSSDDDPFACFEDEAASDAQDSRKVRDPDCGVLAFHSGTEQALLAHVQNQLIAEEQQTPNSVLATIDAFCIERHWMMHCGPEKAAILKDFVRQSVESRRAGSSKMAVVELGSYCGYSSIMLAQTLLEMNTVFHIYSVELDPVHASVADSMIHLAKLDQNVTVLRLDMAGPESQLGTLLQSNLDKDKIDFLFLDHDKDAYLSDLKQLETAGLVGEGTYVAADNVVFAQIENYRTHVKQLAAHDIVETKLVESRLEYSDPDANAPNEAKLCDGIGECSCKHWNTGWPYCCLTWPFRLTSYRLHTELTVYLKDTVKSS